MQQNRTAPLGKRFTEKTDWCWKLLFIGLRPTSVWVHVGCLRTDGVDRMWTP